MATCEIEMNAATDNPILFPEDGDVIAGGNFHGAPLGHAADRLTIAATDVAAISERRIALLMDAAYTGATPFLAPPSDEGLHSGLMMWQVTAAALVSEMKTLSHPASVDTIPTSLGQEDHVSMSMWAAVKLRDVVTRWRSVLAIELLAAWRAASLSERLPQKGLLGAFADCIRDFHPASFDDAALGATIKQTEQLIEDIGSRGVR
jgi:histidine ammonia-lyase